ncbi:hypothetical protein M5D96_011241 [Drosophila gunungcola]|uniref:Uncharacterized protein n=1 Tax=Drosophila gunungcola TaxID=103775 RepID=A0A9Q0BKX2_9MUSC|nr:hypothetical protein M5D96_011241 [Drosophila gunungcola]
MFVVWKTQRMICEICFSTSYKYEVQIDDPGYILGVILSSLWL